MAIKNTTHLLDDVFVTVALMILIWSISLCESWCEQDYFRSWDTTYSGIRQDFLLILLDNFIKRDTFMYTDRIHTTSICYGL